MATKRAKEALERLKTKNPALYKKLTGEDPQGTQQKAREIHNGVDITDVPQHVRQAIWDLDRTAKKPDKDFVALVKDVMAEKKCSVVEAVAEVNRICPQAQQEHIKAANKQTTKQMATAYAGDLDPLDFKKTVRQYRRKYNCSYSEALKMIDKDHLGLRAAYIKKMNE